jgi:protein-arginine kinase activator protein McsA
MKSILKKTQQITLLLFGFVLVFAQQKMKIPNDAAFYMEINGKQLNKKISWDKFNPFLQEITKKKHKKDKDNKDKSSWNDYSKTGIKYDATQYHYGTFNDSVQAYTAHFILDNKEKFQEFINSTKKKGQEVAVEEPQHTGKEDLKTMTLDELNELLNNVLESEDYIRAVAIRDEINSRKKK